MNKVDTERRRCSEVAEKVGEEGEEALSVLAEYFAIMTAVCSCITEREKTSMMRTDCRFATD